MSGIEFKNGCIFYYGNPSGYVENGSAMEGGLAVVDSMFKNEEFIQWLSIHKLTAKWKEGVFEKLSKEGGIIINNEISVPLKDCRIWQLKADISPECKFIGYEELKENFGEPDKNNYEIVYEGEIETNDLESIYTKFNLNHPQGFTGHSLSMSDVVELYDDSGSDFYYVDRFGFKEIEFEEIELESQKQGQDMDMSF